MQPKRPKRKKKTLMTMPPPLSLFSSLSPFKLTFVRLFLESVLGVSPRLQLARALGRHGEEAGRARARQVRLSFFFGSKKKSGEASNIARLFLSVGFSLPLSSCSHSFFRFDEKPLSLSSFPSFFRFHESEREREGTLRST